MPPPKQLEGQASAFLRGLEINVTTPFGGLQRLPERRGTKIGSFGPPWQKARLHIAFDLQFSQHWQRLLIVAVEPKRQGSFKRRIPAGHGATTVNAAIINAAMIGVTMK